MGFKKAARSSSSSATSHAKSLTMYYGIKADIEKGWQLADGTNSTPDMRGFFPRGASLDNQIGTTVGHTTALPTSSAFKTDSDSHYHATTETTITTTSDTHNHTIDGDSAEGINGGGTSTGDATLNNNDGDHDHDFTTTSDAHSHSATIPSLQTGSDSHSHDITSGGDSETAPDHIYIYWIAYTGNLAPNWAA